MPANFNLPRTRCSISCAALLLSQQPTRKPEVASMRPREDVSELTKNAEKMISAVDEAHIMKTLEKRLYPSFDHAEIKVGPVLGVGGYAIVSEVSSIQIQGHGPESEEHDDLDDDHEDHHYELDTARQKMASRCLRHGDARYAIKILDPSLSDLDRTRGLIDMALEVKYLRVLWHPNIGMSPKASTIGYAL
jgi:hypothetical protein